MIDVKCRRNEVRDYGTCYHSCSESMVQRVQRTTDVSRHQMYGGKDTIRSVIK